jgi:hypothetical protein
MTGRRTDRISGRRIGCIQKDRNENRRRKGKRTCGRI